MAKSPLDLPPLCDYENSDYQSAFWVHGGRDYEDQAEAIALKHLLPSHGDWLLEIGAGAGRNTPRYQAFKHIVLMDYSLTQLQQAKAHLENRVTPHADFAGQSKYIYVAANVYRMPFIPAFFDCVTIIRVLHHLVDVPLAIQETQRVMAHNGLLVMEYANKHNLKAILRYWLGKQTWSPFSQEPFEFVKLNYNFHPKWMEGLLRKEGFIIQEKRNVSSFRLGMLKKLLPLSWLVHLDATLQPSGNIFQLSPSVFLRASTSRMKNIMREEASLPFVCPSCRAYPLTQSETSLLCSACGFMYNIIDGIYDLRVS